ALSASFDRPFTVAVDSDGNIYIPDYFNNRLRRVTQALAPGSPASADFPPFPNTEVGQSAPTQNANLSINQPLTISSFNIPPAEGGFQEFAIGSVSGCPLNTVLAPGTVCTIPITFTPAYPGNRSTPIYATYSLPGQQGSSTASVGLTGIGIAP